VQFTRETSDSNIIRAWEPGRLRVGEAWIEGPAIVAPDTILTDWPVSDPNALTIEHLALAIELEPEIILLGTGPDNIIPDVMLMAALAEHAIGLEIMSTPAACRTYNVLVHEGRHVAAALFS
jgi:uncharacterized protein